MKQIKTKIEVSISKIVVMGNGSGFFQVYYQGTINGKTKASMYESSWSSQTNASFRGKLKRGYAIECALRDLLDF